MRISKLLPFLMLTTLLSACGSQDGTYDANGNYVPGPNVTADARRIHAPDPAMMHPDYYRVPEYRHVYRGPVYVYDRAGYYDYNGNYIEDYSSFGVPQNMFPPRGQCRVWFPDREFEDQPAIESCNRIRERVPAGAYVIYGG